MRRFVMLVPLLLVLASCSQKEPETVENRVSWWLTDRSGSAKGTMASLPVYRELQDRLDIAIDFIHPPPGQQSEKLRKMIASGNLPDILSFDFIHGYPGGVQRALDDGVILPLNGLMEEHAPHLSATLEKHPKLLSDITSADGSVTCFPSYLPEAETRHYIGPFIRADLLEKAGLSPPETLDDWTKMLAAFREMEDVEYPMTLYGGKIRDTHAFIGAFGIPWGFYRDGDDVKFGQAQPEFREFLELFRSWYLAGYIDPGFMYNNAQTYARRATSRPCGAYVDYLSALDRYEKGLQKDNPEIRLIPVAYPSISTGDPVSIGFQADSIVSFANAYITRAAAEPKLAARVLDYNYSAEGSLLHNFGIEGESYDMVDGKPVLRDSALSDHYIVAGPYVKHLDSFLGILTRPVQLEALELWSQTDLDPYRVNPMGLDRNGSEELSVIMNRVESFSENTVIGFITGEIPMSEFDAYVAKLEEAGIDRAAEIHRESLR